MTCPGELTPEVGESGHKRPTVSKVLRVLSQGSHCPPDGRKDKPTDSVRLEVRNLPGSVELVLTKGSGRVDETLLYRSDEKFRSGTWTRRGDPS